MDQQQYQDWLDAREDILAELFAALDERARDAFDFSPGSLEPLGAFLYERFPSLAELHDPANRSLHLGLSTYAFEVFRRNLGMEPRLPLDEPSYQYHGMPVLHFPGGPDVCPFDLVTFTVHRREKDLLARVYANQPGLLAEAGATATSSDDIQPNATAEEGAAPWPPMSEEDYNGWLTFLTDRLEGFLDSLDAGLRARFDFSPASLEPAAEILIAAPKSGGALDEVLFADLVSYVGEVFHRNLGFEYFQIEDPEHPAHGQPALRTPSGDAIALPQLVFEVATRCEPKSLLAVFERQSDAWIHEPPADGG